MFVASARVSAQDAAPKSLTAPPGDRQIMLWFEINAPAAPLKEIFPELSAGRKDQLLRDYAVDVIKTWSPSVDTFIVSTRPGQVQSLYPFLMKKKPEGTRIIGGLKTYTLSGCSPDDKRPYDFADAEGWKRIAKESIEIVRATGVPIVLFENQTALTPFHDENKPIDLVKLKESLKALKETDIEFWWNLPQILENHAGSPHQEDRTSALLQAVAEALPNAKFVTGFTAWQGWETHHTKEKERRETMTRIVGRERMIDNLLLGHDGYWNYSPTRKSSRRCYTSAEAVVELSKLPGPVTIYPDSYSWMIMGEEFARLRPRTGR